MSPVVEEAPFVWDAQTMGRPLPYDHPRYCPLCGRELLYSYWDTIDGDRRYKSLVCFGGRNPLVQWLHLKFKTTYVGGTHYQYHFGPDPVTGDRRYDTLTGKPLEKP